MRAKLSLAVTPSLLVLALVVGNPFQPDAGSSARDGLGASGERATGAPATDVPAAGGLVANPALGRLAPVRTPVVTPVSLRAGGHLGASVATAEMVEASLRELDPAQRDLVRTVHRDAAGERVWVLHDGRTVYNRDEIVVGEPGNKR